MEKLENDEANTQTHTHTHSHEWIKQFMLFACLGNEKEYLLEKEEENGENG